MGATVSEQRIITSSQTQNQEYQFISKKHLKEDSQEFESLDKLLLVENQNEESLKEQHKNINKRLFQQQLKIQQLNHKLSLSVHSYSPQKITNSLEFIQLNPVRRTLQTINTNQNYYSNRRSYKGILKQPSTRVSSESKSNRVKFNSHRMVRIITEYSTVRQYQSKSYAGQKNRKTFDY